MSAAVHDKDKVIARLFIPITIYLDLPDSILNYWIALITRIWIQPIAQACELNLRGCHFPCPLLCSVRVVNLSPLRFADANFGIFSLRIAPMAFLMLTNAIPDAFLIQWIERLYLRDYIPLPSHMIVFAVADATLPLVL
jgi:hypothetical protein